jgi:signal peptidase II
MEKIDIMRKLFISEQSNKGLLSSLFLNTGLRWIWLVIGLFLLDQYTKQWAVSSLMELQSIPIFSLLNFTLVYNKGAAFSFLASQPGWQVLFFTAISTIISFILLYWLYRLKAHSERWIAIALSFILSGALGNLYDRVTLEKVVDFIDWHYAMYHFPAFNIADSAIFIGAVMMLWDSFFKPSSRRYS